MHLAQNEPAKTASVPQPVNSSNSSGWQKNYQQRHCSECKVKDWREKLWCTDLDRTNLHRAGNQSHSRWGIPSVRTTLIRETHEHGRQKSEEPGRARQKPTGPLWRRNPNQENLRQHRTLRLDGNLGDSKVHAEPVCTMRGQMKRKEKIRPGEARQ
jgi:hypothetical protein